VERNGARHAEPFGVVGVVGGVIFFLDEDGGGVIADRRRDFCEPVGGGVKATLGVGGVSGGVGEFMRATRGK
jgi:hypothetical protein